MTTKCLYLNAFYRVLSDNKITFIVEGTFSELDTLNSL